MAQNKIATFSWSWRFFPQAFPDMWQPSLVLILIKRFKTTNVTEKDRPTEQHESASLTGI